MHIVLAVVFGYLAGSVPFAYLVARRRGIDLRHAGSGNLGAANVLRTVGVWAAVIVMLLDALKGSAAVLAAQAITTGDAAPVAAGLASIFGHIYPVWLFRGGKGVATAAGMFALLAPVALSIAGVVFVITVVVTRFVSAGSVAAAIALVIAAAVTGAPGPVVAGAVGAATIVVFRHRANMERLVAGTERRVELGPFGR